MQINATQNTPIMLDGLVLEEVSEFTYLGGIMRNKGGTDEDVKARIRKARHAFITLRPIWTNKKLKLSTKIKIFNSNVKTVLLYDAESCMERTGTGQETANIHEPLSPTNFEYLVANEDLK